MVIVATGMAAAMFISAFFLENIVLPDTTLRPELEHVEGAVADKKD